MKKIKIPVEVSARHLHLSKQDAQILFGKNYVFKKLKDVSQPNQYASVETINIVGKKHQINNIRIILPLRDKTQIEITITDSYFLGIKQPPIRISGDLKDSSGGITLKGPKGEVKLKSGLIIAKRHLHIEPQLAKKYNLINNQKVKILIKGTRELIFDEVIVRSHQDIDKLAFQIDTDEANAADININTKAYLLL